MSKHTPGPWKVEAERAYIQIVPADNVAICELRRKGNTELEMANAKLIAAAPDMLAALERIRDSGVWIGLIPHEMMEEAIAKARGCDGFA